MMKENADLPPEIAGIISKMFQQQSLIAITVLSWLRDQLPRNEQPEHLPDPTTLLYGHIAALKRTVSKMDEEYREAAKNLEPGRTPAVCLDYLIKNAKAQIDEFYREYNRPPGG